MSEGFIICTVCGKFDESTRLTQFIKGPACDKCHREEMKKRGHPDDLFKDNEPDVAFTVYLNDGTKRKYTKGYSWKLDTLRALQIIDDENDCIALFNNWESVEDEGHA